MKVHIALVIAFICLHGDDAAICQDKRPCEKYKTEGWCTGTKYEVFVRHECPKTCGFCGLETTTGPIQTVPSVLPPVPTGCGKSSFQHGRVIAGTTAIKGSWPWQINIRRNGKYLCGGSLISPTWVLTAAHCLENINHLTLSVVAGDQDTNLKEGTEQEVQTKQTITHEGWNRAKLTHDIALMELKTPVKFNNYVQPVCLPNQSAEIGKECYITGWGKTRHPGKSNNILQQGRLKIVSKATCSKLNPKIFRAPVTDAMLCAGSGGASLTGTCHGDSGGPFVCNNNGRWTLHGAVSHGPRDCQSKWAYSVFARVHYFREWIRKHSNL